MQPNSAPQPQPDDRPPGVEISDYRRPDPQFVAGPPEQQLLKQSGAVGEHHASPAEAKTAIAAVTGSSLLALLCVALALYKMLGTPYCSDERCGPATFWDYSLPKLAIPGLLIVLIDFIILMRSTRVRYPIVTGIITMIATFLGILATALFLIFYPHG